MAPFIPVPNDLEVRDVRIVDLVWPSSATLTLHLADGASPRATVRCRCVDAEIVRFLSNRDFLVEDGADPVGLDQDHILYRVENSRFYDMQSDTLRYLKPDLKHYCVVTRDACVDIISVNQPTFDAVDNPQADGA